MMFCFRFREQLFLFRVSNFTHPIPVIRFPENKRACKVNLIRSHVPTQFRGSGRRCFRLFWRVERTPATGGGLKLRFRMYIYNLDTGHGHTVSAYNPEKVYFELNYQHCHSNKIYANKKVFLNVLGIVGGVTVDNACVWAGGGRVW